MVSNMTCKDWLFCFTLFAAAFTLGAQQDTIRHILMAIMNLMGIHNAC